MNKPMKIPTPDLSHLTADDYDQVLNVLGENTTMCTGVWASWGQFPHVRCPWTWTGKTEATGGKNIFECVQWERFQAPLVCVEVGGGSGILSTALALQLPLSWWTVSDINFSACKAILRTAKSNGASGLEVVRTSVLSSLSLRGKVDLLLCNPPYVATDEEEVGGQGLSAAWAGGQRGLGVTRALIEQLQDILSPLGLAYIVVEQCNKPDEVMTNIGACY